MGATHTKPGAKGTSEAEHTPPTRASDSREFRPRGNACQAAEGVARPRSRHRNDDATIFSARDLREDRLSRIEAGKTKLWRGSLRITQLVNIGLILIVGLIVIWQDWSFLGAAAGAAIATTGMWLFARRMAPTENRLRRHLLFLSAKRRTCARCGYRIHDLGGDKCPECGARFDPNDDRHLLRAPQTLRIYSMQARRNSAVVIVLAIFWSCALANKSGWATHLALALGGLAAFHCLHALWIHSARAIQKRRGPPTRMPHCPACKTELPVKAARRNPLPDRCPKCQKPLTHGDLFIRPDARWLNDPRVHRIQYRLLILRWCFLVTIFTGLVVFTQVDPVVRRITSLGLGPIGLVLFVVFFIGAAAGALRLLGVRLQRRLKLLFAQVEPQCERCNAPITKVSIGEPCPECGRAMKHGRSSSAGWHG